VTFRPGVAADGRVNGAVALAQATTAPVVRAAAPPADVDGATGADGAIGAPAGDATGSGAATIAAPAPPPPASWRPKGRARAPSATTEAPRTTLLGGGAPVPMLQQVARFAAVGVVAFLIGWGLLRRTGPRHDKPAAPSPAEAARPEAAAACPDGMTPIDAAPGQPRLCIDGVGAARTSCEGGGLRPCSAAETARAPGAPPAAGAVRCCAGPAAPSR
jgi:hypothetical protein